MDNTKIAGIFLIIIGVIFMFSPVISEVFISLFVGATIFIGGLILITGGFAVKNESTPLAVLNIILGFIAAIVGLMMIVNIDLLPFIVGLEFFVIGFIFILLGLVSLAAGISTVSKVSGALSLLLGIVSIIIGIFFAKYTFLISIFIGLGALIQGIRLLLR